MLSKMICHFCNVSWLGAILFYITPADTVPVPVQYLMYLFKASLCSTFNQLNKRSVTYYPARLFLGSSAERSHEKNQYPQFFMYTPSAVQENKSAQTKKNNTNIYRKTLLMSIYKENPFHFSKQWFSELIKTCKK